ncbi:hypothetical protein LOTGIDRAFT_175255 [Lottia gigantea]|uniref:EF-hand domain-containing protein n=1 Tax=Lottia gigantea TaxID=225164 RepID=V4AKB7_LOTGI|nr:hypothetical protein LOTGIDRAFT_175255 [Lottia gigantea]ESO95180.1 hypothetical protein LOTGIDRAFT_175255 [Lottia gigantea]
MLITNLVLCLLFAFSSASPNLFGTGRVSKISYTVADKNSDGKLDLNEFKTELMKYNSDNTLSQSELSNSIIPWSYFQSNGDVSNFWNAFHTIDKNYDGSLSFEEARYP